MKNTMITTGIIVVVVATGAFFGGMQYQKSQGQAGGNMMMGGAAGTAGGMGQGTGAGSNRTFRTGMGARGGGGAVTGEIIAQDDKTITVKMEDGSSKIVNISDKTSINTASEAAIADLKVGEKVAAFGTTNSDGSISAQNVQLNPIMRTFQRDITGMPQQAQ